MIQAITETNFTANLSTEDNRLDTSVGTDKIRFLIKFINDMDGSVSYCYPTITIKNRYTSMLFTYNLAPDMFANQVKMLPSGSWKYEVYEVSWIGSVVVALGTAPSTEIEVLPVLNDNGVVQGIVTKGKLNLSDKSGTGQVQYTQHPEPEETNTIYYGQ